MMGTAAPPRAAVGVLPVSIFRDARVAYVLRRLGEAADEFFDAALLQLGEIMPGASLAQQTAAMASALARTVPQWSPAVIKQRVDRILDLARDFESAAHASFAIYVKDAYAEDLRGRRRKVQICMPRLSDFVHAFFSRVVVCPEVRRGSYFDPASTAARNFAVSNALLDALADMCVENVRVGDMPLPAQTAPSPHRPQPQPQQQPRAHDADSLDESTTAFDDDDEDEEEEEEGEEGQRPRHEMREGGHERRAEMDRAAASGGEARRASAAVNTGVAFAALAASAPGAPSAFPRATGRFNTFMPPATLPLAQGEGEGGGGGVPFAQQPGSLAQQPGSFAQHVGFRAAGEGGGAGGGGVPLGPRPLYAQPYPQPANNAPPRPPSPSSRSSRSSAASHRASASRRRPSKSQSRGAMALIRKLRKMEA